MLEWAFDAVAGLVTSLVGPRSRLFIVDGAQKGVMVPSRPLLQ